MKSPARFSDDEVSCNYYKQIRTRVLTLTHCSTFVRSQSSIAS
jgi:hypothetical protein